MIKAGTAAPIGKSFNNQKSAFINPTNVSRKPRRCCAFYW
jgi:hypothetical protein